MQDLMFLLGGALVVAGCWLWSPAVALVVGGVLLMVGAGVYAWTDL